MVEEPSTRFGVTEEKISSGTALMPVRLLQLGIVSRSGEFIFFLCAFLAIFISYILILAFRRTSLYRERMYGGVGLCYRRNHVSPLWECITERQSIYELVRRSVQSP